MTNFTSPDSNIWERLREPRLPALKTPDHTFPKGDPGRSPSRLVGYTFEYLRYCVRTNVRYIYELRRLVKRKFSSAGSLRPTALPFPALFPARSSLDSMSDASLLPAALADRYRIERELGAAAWPRSISRRISVTSGRSR